MKALLISDKEYDDSVYEDLHQQVSALLTKKGFIIEERAIGKGELAFCVGCFGCWVKKPGECVIDDGMSQINRNFIDSDIVVYFCPVVFGQPSANIKITLDRWLPNILPFFEIRPDGSTMHPGRYERYPKKIMIGYGNALSEEDQILFTDITKKHLRNVETFIYDGKPDEMRKALQTITFEKVGGTL
jgi:multimeric flavodoxin WrbA